VVGLVDVKLTRKATVYSAVAFALVGAFGIVAVPTPSSVTMFVVGDAGSSFDTVVPNQEERSRGSCTAVGPDLC
jgi:hypothetical protein